ncbi:MAG: hypothetical protein QOD92_1042 [Acidimicrobiaceae bacterium]|jgi:TP901 family phage tail tape measure protein
MNRVIAVVLSAEAGSYKSTMLAASGATKDFEKSVESGGQSASKFATAAKAAGAAIALVLAAIAVSALAMSVDFDRAMRNVNSVSQLPEQAFKGLEQSVLDLSKAVPQSATALAEGLYDIASSGFQGAEGLKILEASARAATAGLSDTQTASQAIVGVINAYGLSAEAAAHISDVLFQTVNVGVLSFSDLAQNLGDVIGVGSAAKVSISELGAAVAAMTLAGIGPAEAFTSLNRVILGFIKPTEAMGNLMHNLGFESAFTALQTLGLHGVMEKLREVTGGSAIALTTLFGDVRGGRGAFALMAAEGQNYATTFAAINDETNVAGATQRAFNEQMKSLSAQWDLFVNRLSAGAIQIGLLAIPALSLGLGGVQHGIEQLVQAGQRAGDVLTPFFSGLGSAAMHLSGLVGTLAHDLGPLATVLAVIAASGAAATLNGIGIGVDKLTGFLERNQIVVEAVAALYAAKLAGAFFAAGGGAETLALKVMYLADSLGGMGAALIAAAPLLLPLVAILPLMQISMNGAAESAAQAARETANYTAAVQKNTGSLEENLRAATAENIANSDVYQTIKDVGLSVADMTNEVMSSTPEFARFAQGIHDAGVGTSEFVNAVAAGRGSTDPFVRSMVELYDAGKLTEWQLKNITGETKTLANEQHAAVDKMQALHDVQGALGISTDSLSSSTAGAASNTAELKRQAEQAAKAMESVAKATKLAHDAYLASVDPLFAMLRAAADNAKAQADLAAKQADGKTTAQELAEAQLHVAETAAKMNAEAINLVGAVEAGTLSVDRAKGMLNDWVSQGLITQQTADTVAAKFDEIAAKADALQGKNITIQMAVDAAAAEATIQALFSKWDRGIITVGIQGHNIGNAQRWGGVVEHAATGLVRFRSADIYNQPTYGIAERETGGEAFIPKYGNRARSLAIAATAAGWYGASVVDQSKKAARRSAPGSMERAAMVGIAPVGAGGGVTYNVQVSHNPVVNLPNYVGDRNDVVRAVTGAMSDQHGDLVEATAEALRQHDRGLR